MIITMASAGRAPAHATSDVDQDIPNTFENVTTTDTRDSNLRLIFLSHIIKI